MEGKRCMLLRSETPIISHYNFYNKLGPTFNIKVGGPPLKKIFTIFMKWDPLLGIIFDQDSTYVRDFFFF